MIIIINLVSDNDIRLVLMTVHLELGDGLFFLFWMFLLVVLRNGERRGNLSSMVSGLKQKSRISATSFSVRLCS